MKGTIKLFTRFVILGIPLYVMMLYAALRPMAYMPVEYAMWQEEKDYVESGKGADVIIVGDSRAKSGIIPELLGEDVDSYNMAIGGCNSIEMYFAVKRYLAAHEAPGEALVIFAPYHFCDIDNWGQTMSFNYLDASQLLSVYADAARLEETDKLGEHFFTDVFSYKLRLPNKYLASMYTARVNGRLPENSAKYDSVRADKGYTQFGDEEGNDKLNYETHHEIFDTSPLVTLYYSRLLEELEAAGCSVKIIQSPVNTASGEAITEEFYKGFSSMMEGIKADHPDFTVETEVPVYDNKYFGDNNHLNRAGAEVFTAEIRERYFDAD